MDLIGWLSSSAVILLTVVAVLQVTLLFRITLLLTQIMEQLQETRAENRSILWEVMAAIRDANHANQDLSVDPRKYDT